MWRYLDGVTPPKCKQSTEERKERDQSYEKRRKRVFVNSWKKDRSWLRVETKADGEEVMFCDFCIKAEISADKTNFINGCKSLKLELTPTMDLTMIAPMMTLMMCLTKLLNTDFKTTHIYIYETSYTCQKVDNTE